MFHYQQMPATTTPSAVTGEESSCWMGLLLSKSTAMSFLRLVLLDELNLC